MESRITKKQESITLAGAQKLTQFGLELANEKGLNIAIAIVNNSGHLIAFVRMEDASLVTIDVAIGKAKTASYLKAPSKVFEDFINEGKASMATTPNILPLQGGIPIYYNNELIGAVGVSGSDGDTDNAIATAIAQHLK